MATYVAENVHIDPRAEIDDEVEIGPFCVIGPHVRIGRGTKLLNTVTLTGHVTLGQYNQVYAGAVIGGEPQDISYSGGETCVTIGDHNLIREYVTIHRGTKPGSTTRMLSDAGVAPERIAVDPGIGFGKQLAHNLALVRGLPEIASLGYPVVLGASRKRFIGEISGVDDPRERTAGSVAAAVYAAEHGASVVRVHDVAETVQALAVERAIVVGAE